MTKRLQSVDFLRSLLEIFLGILVVLFFAAIDFAKSCSYNKLDRCIDDVLISVFGEKTRVRLVYGDATARRPRQPIRRRQCPPFLDFYTYFRHYRAFCVAINSFSVTLKFLKGILNIHFSSDAILIPLRRTKSGVKISRRKKI